MTKKDMKLNWISAASMGTGIVAGSTISRATSVDLGRVVSLLVGAGAAAVVALLVYMVLNKFFGSKADPE